VRQIQLMGFITLPTHHSKESLA